ncbi:MAG: YrbL family protein [Tateyamaria sp.]|uniref:YrbL family protein n=1 Tax=Tateyamaria sp. TaxID=1929288 RepID=UPI00329F4CE3
MMSWKDTVKLDRTNLIAQGENRLVYQHPTQDHLLIKLPKPNSRDERKLKSWGLKRPALMRYGNLRTMQREQDEYTALLWRNNTIPTFLSRPMGICGTTLGPGALYEKIADHDGSLAPTVGAMCKAGSATEEFAVKLGAFFDLLIDQGCIAPGINSGNIVVQGGGERFYLIDGLGELVLIKTQWLSERLRRRNLEKQKDAMLDLVRSHIP